MKLSIQFLTLVFLHPPLLNAMDDIFLGLIIMLLNVLKINSEFIRTYIFV